MTELMIFKQSELFGAAHVILYCVGDLEFLSICINAQIKHAIICDLMTKIWTNLNMILKSELHLNTLIW